MKTKKGEIMEWIVGIIILIVIINLFKSKKSSSSESYETSSYSSNERRCSHDWGKWYKVNGNDSYMGRPIYNKRRCKKCGEVDF